LHSTVYDELLPIFLSTGIKWGTPLANGPFPGGLGMDSGNVGSLLSLNGFVGIFLVAFGYPYIERLFGTIRPFRLVMKGHPLIYIWTPFFLFLANMPQNVVLTVVAISSFFRVSLTALSFPPLLLLVNRVAPKQHLGTVNGSVQMVGAFARAVGPIVWGYLMETGQRTGHVELPWWTLAVTAIIPAFLSYRIHDSEEEDDEEHDTDDDN
jgi:cyanate permease